MKYSTEWYSTNTHAQGCSMNRLCTHIQKHPHADSYVCHHPNTSQWTILHLYLCVRVCVCAWEYGSHSDWTIIAVNGKSFLNNDTSRMAATLCRSYFIAYSLYATELNTFQLRRSQSNIRGQDLVRFSLIMLFPICLGLGLACHALFNPNFSKS